MGKNYKYRKPYAMCGVEFEFMAQSYFKRDYCSKDCRDRAQTLKAQQRQDMKRLLKMTFGDFGLEVDPWATGQLPESVTRNALWG